MQLRGSLVSPAQERAGRSWLNVGDRRAGCSGNDIDSRIVDRQTRNGRFDAVGRSHAVREALLTKCKPRYPARACASANASRRYGWHEVPGAGFSPAIRQDWRCGSCRARNAATRQRVGSNALDAFVTDQTFHSLQRAATRDWHALRGRCARSLTSDRRAPA
jgi:hypothetical protein